MRRLGLHADSGWFRGNLLSFEGWYHLLADYGDNWRRPLTILLASLLMWPGVLAATASVLPNQNVVEFAGLTKWLTVLDMRDRVLGMLDLWAYSIRVASSFLSDPGPQNLGATLAQLFLRIASPFLAFLAGSAIRRKFRR